MTTPESRRIMVEEGWPADTGETRNPLISALQVGAELQASGSAGGWQGAAANMGGGKAAGGVNVGLLLLDGAPKRGLVNAYVYLHNILTKHIEHIEMPG